MTEGKKTSTSQTVKKAKLTWLPKKTFELEFTLPWHKVKKAYDQALKEAAKTATIQGFRKGKAPLDLVEKNLDQQKLYQQVLSALLPQTYAEAVKQHHLKPMMSPKITPLATEEGQEWTFKATSCEAPEVKLGDYQKAVKGELAKEKIWLPGKDKDKEEKKSAQKTYDQKLKIITQTLLKTAQVEISDLLIEDELNRMLTRLLDQINSLGMTIDQYAQSKGITTQQLRTSYQQQAEQTLKLEFILQAIVEERKIQVGQNEVDKIIQATADEKIKQKLNTPLQRAYISAILAKRKALDYLTNL